MGAGLSLLAGLYVVVKSPRYEASARIEVSPAGTNSMGLDELADECWGRRSQPSSCKAQ